MTAQPSKSPRPRTRRANSDRSRSRTHRRDAASTKARLLASARRLFLSQGFTGTGLRQIAAEAGVDVTLVRRYFGSKQQLFLDATDLDTDIQQIWTATQDEIPHLLIRRVLATHDAADAPLFALLRSSGDAAVVRRLVEQLDRGLTQPLAETIDAPDRQLRADLITALLLGVGVIRTLLKKRPIVDADEAEIAKLFDQAFQAIAKPGERSVPPHA